MSTDDLLPNVVPLKPGLSLRFYEAVLLLYCLKEVKSRFKSVKEPEPDLESDKGKSSKNAFRCFVDKLGQICDNGLAGKTVTAFAVLQPGEIQYRFASNQRTNEELKEVKKYIENVLRTLGDTPDDQLDGVNRAVLEEVIAFNQPTITQYIKNLTKEQWMGHCLEVCEEENNVGGYTGREAAREINSLRKFAWLSAPGDGPSQESFVTETRELLETINQLYNSPFYSFMREKARADRDPAAKTPWSELRHAFGRLQSYNVAIKTLISMRRRRRELFEIFEVIPVPSSGQSCPNVRRSVKRILDRFPKDMRIAEAYHLNLPKEQQRDLEEMIETYGTAKKGNFRTYVHAELVLLNSILTEEQREGVPVHFFAEADYDRYIGSSKDTCRLCKLYIDNHPSGVEFRHSHGNIYRNWRAPDIYEEDGVNVAQLTKTRENIHNKMVESLRQTINRTIVENVVERRHHDSTSSPTGYIRGSGSTCNSHLAVQAPPYNMDSISTRGEMDDSDELAATLGRLSIAGDGGRSSSSPSVGRSSQDTTPVPESNVGSPFVSPSEQKPSMNRRQRPLIIEVEDSE